MLTPQEARRLRLETMKEACQYALLKWKPKEEDGKLITYCNLSCNFISVKMGFDGFRGMMANQMVNRMTNAPDFSVVEAKAAQDIANDGRLVIAGIKGDVMPNGHLDHGHVAVCYYGILVYSKKWNCDAPTICNVGKDNRFTTANFGFRDQPKYYAWVNEA